MILDLKLDMNDKGDILNKQADYNPSLEVKERTVQVLKDFQTANVLHNKPYPEFQFQSLLTRMNIDQMSWNQYPGDKPADPAQAWRSMAFRPIVRNKIISIAAHITASVIYPKVFAFNDNSQEEKDAEAVMRSLIEWAGENSNGGQQNYERTFLYSVLAALVNPAAFIYTEYTESHRKIKERDENGKLVEKEILDELFSGFQDVLVPCDELWISNIYQHDIQKQPFLIWRRVIDYTTAKAKYSNCPNFEKYVSPGVQYLYSDFQQLFYQVYDQSLRANLVEEVIYWNRTADLRLRFVNGVLMDDVDEPNPRKDKMYPFVKGGYELFDDGRFFYYKSLAYKLANDEDVVNTAYRMVVDGTYLQIMPPAVVFGKSMNGSKVTSPGAVTVIDNSENPNASFQTIATNNNRSAGMNLIEKVESSISESSSDILQAGQASGDKQTAYEISKLDQNARVMLGLFGKMIGFMVKDFGILRIGDILQYLTIGEVSQIEGTSGMLKFQKFLIPDKQVGGKSKSQRIEFDMNMPNQVTKEQEMEISRSLLKQEKDMGDETQLFKVNPELFRNLKFKCFVHPEAVSPKSDVLKKAMMLEEYGLAIANPLTNKEAITRELLLGAYDTTKEDPDRFMMSEQELQMQMQPQSGGLPQALSASGEQPKNNLEKVL